jgi:hypothetical protein
LSASPGEFAPSEVQQPFGDGPLGAIEAGKEKAIGLAKPIDHHGAIGQFEPQRAADQVLRYLQKLFDK